MLAELRKTFLNFNQTRILAIKWPLSLATSLAECRITSAWINCRVARINNMLQEKKLFEKTPIYNLSIRRTIKMSRFVNPTRAFAIAALDELVNPRLLASATVTCLWHLSYDSHQAIHSLRFHWNHQRISVYNVWRYIFYLVYRYAANTFKL